eukprot:gene7618-13430_t
MGLASLCSCAFDGQECLDAHNTLRRKHVGTGTLKYSEELAKETQDYANLLALLDEDTKTPKRDLPKRRRRNVDPEEKKNFHKEMWDGEILFPDSKWDLNRNREIHVGESIHKFCCYTFCPRDFFHGLNFPPSAKGVVNHWYKEVKNYDFAKGESVSPSAPIKHFTNIVWKKTTEIGCGQSKRSKTGCIYTVTRYRIIGSIGDPENFKNNVAAVDSANDSSSARASSSFLVAFVIVIVIVFILVSLGVFAYIKRNQIKEAYYEWQIKHETNKTIAALHEDYDKGSFHGKKSFIYRASSKRTRPSILVVPNEPLPNTLPLEPREPVPTYENLVVVYQREDESVNVYEKVIDEKRQLPLRPKSPVKADFPALQAAPPPPPSGCKPTLRIDSSSEYIEPSSIGNERSNASKVCSKKPLLPQKKSNPDKVEIEKKNPSASNVAQGPIRAPIPAPRTPKISNPGEIPVAAPRPQRPMAPPRNQFDRTIKPGRASKKNPNFRTLPLNDRGSLRRPEKLESSPNDSGTPCLPDNNGNSNVAEDKKIDGTVAKKPIAPPKPQMAPPKKSLQNGDGEKPLLTKHLEPVKEERPTSVAEMRKLLEQKSQR